MALILSPLPSTLRATSTVGLYADQNGSLCSLTGNQPGLVTAYVVVKPDAAGILAVRFSAPIPACLGATFVSEAPPDGAFSIGASETGISVAVPFCITEPATVLQITYLRTSTTPCCEFRLQDDPFVGKIEGTLCNFGETILTASTSYFNADSTCVCGDSHPPYPPHTPTPSDYSTWVVMDTALRWEYSPYDGDIISNDVYLGTDPTPGLVATIGMTPYYQPPQELAENTTYYWRVVVHDVEGFATAGPLWTFTTRLLNQPPAAPYHPTPANNATLVAPDITLRWVGFDAEGDPLTYDVYFGTETVPPLVSSGQSEVTYHPGTLAHATLYRWQVVARDNHNHETRGPLWSFSTKPQFNAPAIPTVVSPSSGASNVDLNADLQWNCSDPDGDALSYDVYFGTAVAPPLAAANHPAKTYDPGTLAFSTRYYWRIVARDPGGLETSSSTWTFLTKANGLPTTPSNPSPAHNATGVSLNATLAWTSTDDQPGLVFDVSFGTTSSPPLVASSLSTASYTPGPLAPQTAYYWRVLARDASGQARTGPLWMFTTMMHPTAYNPSPADNGSGTEPLTLGWTTNDPGLRPILCDLYFGIANPPPLLTSGIGASVGYTTFSYPVQEDLVVGTRYYWRVYSYTSSGGNLGPVWSFTLRQLGDMDLDGAITLGDAACALEIALKNTTCAAPGAWTLADVNCSAGVTPRDALCIHKQAIGQSCPFCGQSLEAGEAMMPPIVTRSSYSESGNMMYFTLAVSDLSSLESFGFAVTKPGNVALTQALRRDATGGFTALEFVNSANAAYVGGYTLAPASLSGTTDFIELRFQLGGSLIGELSVSGFMDDLSGAPSVFLISHGGGKGGGNLPVIFSRFDATAAGDGVRIGWELQHEDALSGYTLYRGADGAPPSVVLTQGEVSLTGSYLDRSVEPGRTYRYMMLVRASDGDEFQSPVATVQMPGIELSLGPNHPNPFNPQTTIPYYVPAGGSVRVRLAIYDTSGRLVRALVDESQTGGAREVVWRGEDGNGKPVTSGVYFCVLQVDNERRTRKLVLLK
jgi:hypothetical protein